MKNIQNFHISKVNTIKKVIVGQNLVNFEKFRDPI